MLSHLQAEAWRESYPRHSLGRRSNPSLRIDVADLPKASPLQFPKETVVPDDGVEPPLPVCETGALPLN